MLPFSRGWRAGALALTTAALGGCAVLESLELPASVPPVAGSAVLDGEVRSLDTRRGRIEIRPEGGRTLMVSYDRSTRVEEGRATYPVTALRRGDQVRVWTSRDRSGELWADRVEVWSARSAARVERLDGRVGTVRPDEGWFSVQEGRAPAVIVHVPARTQREEIRRLERLRPGSRVSLDVLPLGAREAELVRFR